MRFFFVLDYRHNYRYFSSEGLSPIQVNFSRLKRIWETARKKLMLLPQRILRQEQAFERVLKLENENIVILHSGRLSEKKIKHKFFFFLQKQRTKHILYLIGETILLPVTGLAALLPGPNVFFGVVALLMITHWQAFKGINKLLKKEYRFIPDTPLRDWEQELESRGEGNFSRILETIATEHQLPNIQKVLWK